MSLPSIATFYKDEKIVGAACINIGWYVTPEGITTCLGDALDSAMKFYGEHSDWHPRHAEDMAPYFTTLKDLKAFDHITLYGYKIPRSAMSFLLEKPENSKKFEQALTKFEEIVEEFAGKDSKYYS